MQGSIQQVIREGMRVDYADPKRIQHFLKVYELSRLIGIEEGMEGRELEILEGASVLHDIGIPNAEKRWGNSHGHYQELEGPPVAREILTRLKWPEDEIERICYLIGHHHTYTNIDGLDYQILVEADFLVNLYEDDSDDETKVNVYKNIFRTESGKAVFKEMFGIPVEV